ncbi:hypothetical protein NL676_004058 [Syzygium grande]|nr:hypothetical protein NL676_004058 [Syzygium grande]
MILISVVGEGRKGVGEMGGKQRKQIVMPPPTISDTHRAPTNCLLGEVVNRRTDPRGSSKARAKTRVGRPGHGTATGREPCGSCAAHGAKNLRKDRAMAGVSVKCGDRGTLLKSMEEAQGHAEHTSHSNFSESTEAVLNFIYSSCEKPYQSPSFVAF